MLRAALQCARRTTARGARWRCDAPAVSARGVAAPRLLPTYLADARGVAMYDAQMSPDGVLQLSVAENQMIEDLLVPKLREVHPASDFERGQIYYQPTAGTAQCRAAVGAHLSRVLGRGEYEVDPERLVVGAGCNAVLENLLFTIADAGEAVLIPRPYYAAFEFDLAARARMAIVGVESGGGGDAASYYPTPAALEAAYARAASAGLAPRVLLLSSPNNPLGIVYPAEVLGACLDWAASKPNLHVVSDEIYAGSIFREGDGAPRWTSVLGVAAQAGRALGDRCHVVWALSKDFALSGMRVGAPSHLRPRRPCAPAAPTRPPAAQAHCTPRTRRSCCRCRSSTTCVRSHPRRSAPSLVFSRTPTAPASCGRRPLKPRTHRAFARGTTG